ncbi:MAG: hypothetical protein KJ718_00825, partial [Nanoarchaeota archaeon]|nr:hypothetical protein [Nanoarchaeota archaeon]
MEELNPEKLSEAINKASLNLVSFRHIILNTNSTDVEPAKFHYIWSDWLLNSHEHCAIEAFRESAKTQYILRAFLLYSLTFPSEDRDYIVLIKKNSTLAGNKLHEIESEYKNNPITFSTCEKIQEESSEAFSVDVKRDGKKAINVRIEAYGKGASIRGLANIDRRPKIVIIDDPQDLEDCLSETVVENDWNWFLSDVVFLGQSTRIFIMGNNLGEKCIIERLLNIGGTLEKVKFNTLRTPITDDEGNPTWPEKYNIEEIENEKRDYERLGKVDIWLRERKCLAYDEKTQIFHNDDYRYFAAPLVYDLIKGCNLYATLDPATSKNKSSCYRALVINAVNWENNWFLPKIYFGRWDSFQLMNILFDTRTQWKDYGLRDFGIEKGEYKDVIEPFLHEEMKRRNIFFNIIPIEHAKIGSKLERIKMLQPRFKSHSIWFPDDDPDWVIELRTELRGVTNSEIKSLFIDLADGLAMQEQIAV